MLNFIIGRSGSGKTEYIKNNLILNNERDSIIYIVPEQYSFESERELAELGTHQNVKLSSFTRICNDIFKQYGGLSGNYISQTGKEILMYSAIDSVCDNLVIYNKNYSSPEFVSLLLKTDELFKNKGITTQMLTSVTTAVETDLLKNKISDISLILDSYKALVSQKYRDSADDLKRATQKADENNFFVGKTVIIDEFKGFTADQLSFIEIVLRQAQNLYISICADSINDFESKTDIFTVSKKTINKIKQIAEKNSVTVNDEIVVDEGLRFNSKELLHLEKNVFRSNAYVSEIITEDVSIAVCKNIIEEAKYISSEISKLVRNGNIRYRDIAVIGRNISDYSDYIESIFKRYDIPFFFDADEPIMHYSLPIFIASLFNVITNGYKTEDILRLLKTRLITFPDDILNANITDDVVLALENYAYIWSIDKKDWQSEFTKSPRGIEKIFVKNDEEKSKIIKQDLLLLGLLEKTRKFIFDNIDNFKKSIVDSTGEDFAKALYEVLVNFGVDKSIQKQNEKIDENQTQTSIWDMVCDIITDISYILGDGKLSREKYFDIVLLSLNSSVVGKIPKTLDQVLVGSAERIRTNKPKVVFIIGANDGVFPNNVSADGIFTEQDILALNKAGIDFDNSSFIKATEELYYAYKALTTSSDKVYISYIKDNMEGGSFYPSIIVNSVLSIFKNIKQIDTEKKSAIEFVYNNKSAFSEYAKRIKNYDEEIYVLEEHLKDNPDFSNRYNLLKNAVSNTPINLQNKSLIDNVFAKNNRNLSPTAIELYYNCPFAYFLERGIKIKKLQKAQISFAEFGSIVHFVLEVVFKICFSKDKNQLMKTVSQEDVKLFDTLYDIAELKDISLLCSIEKQKILPVIENIISHYFKNSMNGINIQEGRTKYLIERVKYTLVILINKIAQEFAQSEFKPYKFELEIKEGGEVEPLKIQTKDGDVTLKGFVDRLDIATIDDTTYVRVVDYKTNSKEFKLSDVLEGISLQMLIYLFAVCKAKFDDLQNIKPAGILYMPSKISTASLKRGDDEKGELEKLQCMNGLLINNQDVLYKMEKDLNKNYIPVTTDRNGDLKLNDTLVTETDFLLLEQAVTQLVCDMHENLRAGKVSPLPRVSKNSFGGDKLYCQVCAYKNVCKHEDGDACNKASELKYDKALSKLRGE